MPSPSLVKRVFLSQNKRIKKLKPPLQPKKSIHEKEIFTIRLL